MAEIPQLLNRMDFISILLPGYIAVILSLVLFRPDLLDVGTETEGGVSFDLFSAVVFLVAGPAVGLLIEGLHRSISSFYDTIRSGGSGRSAFLVEYARVKIESSPDEKNELDFAEAWYDFLVSTACILFLIGTYYVLTPKSEIYIAVPLFAVSAIFFVNGWLEWKEGYGPIYDALKRKHP